jgi:hypothetical protein
MLGLLTSRVGLVFAAITAGLVFLTWSHLSAYRAGADMERTASLTRSVESLRERNATDDQVRNMDSIALCRALGGLPDECSGFGL